MTSRTLAILALNIVLLAGCGGSHGEAVLPAHGDRVASTFVIRWPARNAASSIRRKPQTISPSALSVVVEVNGDASLTTIANRPAGSSASSSSVIVLTPPGTDTFVFSLYDGQDGTGNELGQQTVSQTIAAGTNNQIKVTIDSLVSAVRIQPLPNQPAVSATTGPNGPVYTISGDRAITFFATPLDADGNVIVGPSDPITYSASSPSAGITVAAVNGQPNQWVVRANGLTSSGNTAALTVQATDGQGTFTQNNAQLALAPLLFVAYENYQNSGNGTVVALDPSGNIATLAGSFPGIGDPKGIAFDSADHRLYVADARANKVLAFNSDGTAVGAAFTSPAFNSPIALAYDDRNGVLYVVDAAGVHAMKPDGSAAPLTTSSTPFAGLSQADGVAVDENTNAQTSTIYVTDQATNSALRFDESGNPANSGVGFPTNVISLGSLTPTAVAADGNADTLLFAGNALGTPQIVGILSTGAPVATQTTGLSGPSGAAYSGATDQFFISNSTSGTVTVYDALLAGLARTIAAPAMLSSPSALTLVN